MGVFTVASALRAAAMDAGHELGVFEALSSPRTIEELAEHARVRPTHRFVALVDALVALGALVRDGSSLSRGSIASRSAHPMIGGWGAIAEVIRTDTPLATEDAEIAQRYQRHLVVAGAPAAREVAAMLVARRAIDLGGGAGAYTRAILEADPGARVTLVDAADVIAIAREELGELADRVELVAGDARDVDVPPTFELAIVANVLHLHGPAVCADICSSAARAVGPGGTVAIIDLRRGTPEGEMFALNMALYTDRGSVYSVETIAAWLRDAGLVDIEERRLESAPEMVVVLARKPAV